jgi:hypothetical protein
MIASTKTVITVENIIHAPVTKYGNTGPVPNILPNGAAPVMNGMHQALRMM